MPTSLITLDDIEAKYFSDQLAIVTIVQWTIYWFLKSPDSIVIAQSFLWIIWILLTAFPR